MKRRPLVPLLLLSLSLLLLAPSCIVRSVEPWLQDDSLVFEDDLLGGWVGKDAGSDDVAMTFLKADEANTYLVTYAGKNGQGSFLGRLGKFGSDYYLDFWPQEEAPGVDGMLLFPTHSVAHLDIGADRLSVRILNYDAVKEAAKLDRLGNLRYFWTDKKELIFVSKTEDLQRWLLEIGRDSKLFAPPMRLTRKK